MRNIIIFGGTTEGRELTEFFVKEKKEVFVSVTTKLGADLLPSSPFVKLLIGKKDIEGLEFDFCKNNINLCIDATHPYATEITENLLKTCNKLKIQYMRVSRDVSFDGPINKFDNFPSLIKALETLSENVLVTTGVKELEELSYMKDSYKYLYPRILPIPENLQKTIDLGFKVPNIICMQGPFTKEMNIALIHQYNIKGLVTKITGRNGGFNEKYEACRETGIPIFALVKSSDDLGFSVEAVEEILKKEMF